MMFRKVHTLGALSIAISYLFSGSASARGELQWQSLKLEPMRMRLIALARNHLRSSYFKNEEVFIADRQLGKEESRMVKLVYGFLPYQPRLSENGFNYSTVHELRAARDPECDETIAQITTGKLGDWREDQSQLKYSTDAPALNLSRNKSRLPCYVTSADDYRRQVREPASE